MTLKPEFFRYLDHFGRTMPMRELHAQPHAANAIGLRHDIDHNLDLALEVAYHEHQRGIRATYYLLHTHPYWQDDQLLIKCQQLQAYGHEVALHVNLLTPWFECEFDDPNAALGAVLQQLRDGGINITGMSAHGDKSCYKHQFINYWLFRELRGDDPASTERGLSPEGIPVDDPQRQVRYPEDHRLKRGDGQSLPLWSISMATHGIDYDAAHVPVDQYWTDTGGQWTRSPDPLTADLSRGRHQVLMHPYWWRGPHKFIFVLSPARSGSTWLANFVNRATTCMGLHEWSLNHRRESKDFTHDKRTNGDYVSLIEDQPLIEKLIDTTNVYFRMQKRDVLEANVYLEPFVTQIRVKMPEARFVHLHRNGRDVVRSILNRHWYDTPLDRKHRAVPIPQWQHFTQFQRACWYFRFTTERLTEVTDFRLSFERMVRDLEYLTQRLAELGIIVHPLLAEHEFNKRLNAATTEEIPRFTHWPEDMQNEFENICGPAQRLLGYESSDGTPVPDPTRKRHVGASRALCRWRFAQADLREFSTRGLELSQRRTGLVLTRAGKPADGAAYLLLARGSWTRVEPGNAPFSGMPCRTGVMWRARIRAKVPAGPLVRLFVIYFDDNGEQIDKQQLAALRSDEIRCELAFTRTASAAKMALGIHIINATPGTQIVLKSLALIEHQVDHRYRLAIPQSSAAAHATA